MIRGAEAKGPPVTGWRLLLVCIVAGALLGAIAGFGIAYQIKRDLAAFSHTHECRCPR